MLRSIRNVKLLKCVSLICLSPLFVFYSSLNFDGPRTKAFMNNKYLVKRSLYLRQNQGGKRRGLGPRNDVLTTCEAITLRDGQRIIAAFFRQ